MLHFNGEFELLRSDDVSFVVQFRNGNQVVYELRMSERLSLDGNNRRLHYIFTQDFSFTNVTVWTESDSLDWDWWGNWFSQMAEISAGNIITMEILNYGCPWFDVSVSIQARVQSLLRFHGNTHTAGTAPLQRSALIHTIPGRNTLVKTAPFGNYEFAGWGRAANGTGEIFQPEQTASFAHTTDLHAMWRFSCPDAGAGNEALYIQRDNQMLPVAQIVKG